MTKEGKNTAELERIMKESEVIRDPRLELLAKIREDVKSGKVTGGQFFHLTEEDAMDFTLEDAAFYEKLRNETVTEKEYDKYRLDLEEIYLEIGKNKEQKGRIETRDALQRVEDHELLPARSALAAYGAKIIMKKGLAQDLKDMDI